MQSGMTAALRVLEGLMIAGGEAGMLVCYSDLKELLPEMGIGDYSIRQALKTVAPNGEMLFKSVDFSPPHTPSDKHKANAAFDTTVSHTTNALLLISQNQQKPGGRPKQYVEIPSNERLCKLFEVEAGGE